MNLNLLKLKELSARIGKDSNLVQSSGGNTSIKDNGVLWVKASGKKLRDALNENIFVALDLEKLKIKFSDPAYEENFDREKICGSNLKSSIETSLHALMPYSVVLHTHPIDIMALSTMSNSREKIAELLQGIDWKWVPYNRPGKPLSLEVNKIFSSSIRNIPKVLILANHGLVVGEDTIEKAEELQKNVIDRLRLIPRKINSPNHRKLIKIINSIPNSRLPKSEIIHTLGNDNWSFKLAKQNPPYPDHIVFCGAKPWIIEELNLPSEEKCYGIIKNVGLILLENANSSVEEMLVAQAETFLRIPVNKKVNFLTNKDCNELINWDAEKYRQNLNLKDSK